MYQSRIFIIILLFILSGCATPVSKPQIPKTQQCFIDPASLRNYENQDLQYLDKQYFHVLYSNHHLQPQVVVYEFHFSPSYQTLRRGVDFNQNTFMDKEARVSPRNKDYAKSGLHKGHIAPSKDFSFSLEAVKSTYVLSNISPQVPRFNNGGSWFVLEEMTRKIATGKKVQVIAGPVLRKGLRRLKGESDTPSIPEHFYRILIYEEDGSCHFRAVWTANQEDRIIENADPWMIDVPIRALFNHLRQTTSP